MALCPRSGGLLPRHASILSSLLRLQQEDNDADDEPDKNAPESPRKDVKVVLIRLVVCVIDRLLR